MCRPSLGHKADLGVMALGPDLSRLQAFQVELAATGAAAGVLLPVADRAQGVRQHRRARSGRLSEHAEGRDAGPSSRGWRPGAPAWPSTREDKLHPRLPRKRLICFYPMSKRRVGR